MRKQIVPSISSQSAFAPEKWLGLEHSARIAITSEDPAHSIEGALLSDKGGRWKATEPGKQTIRILFDEPQTLPLIHLVFAQEDGSRTQEFVLRWSNGDPKPFQEMVRQQYNFTPGSSEIEDYTVDLHHVTALELEITPSIEGNDYHASLDELRLSLNPISEASGTTIGKYSARVFFWDKGIRPSLRVRALQRPN